MPRLYTPPVARRTQAVQASSGSERARLPQRWSGLWLAPLLGLLPVMVAVVIASQGRFGTPGGTPMASAPGATLTPGAAATPVAVVQATSAATPAPPANQQAVATTLAQATALATQAPASGPGVASAAVTVQADAGSTTSSGSGPFRAYRVQPGDTLWFVAQRFGVSAVSIAQASGLQNPDHLRVGQVLTVPSQPGWLYRVQSGETLDQIAARTGVPSPLIASVSNLTTDAVQPGAVILIPDQSAAPGK
ncbi:MAG: LysM peptidoglycan-binding domain-containing protein [Chloroflexota bacterium]|nr:LysM peptidoglycan-binding domain-containing protein [Chloroflexota bacterium]